LAWLRQKYGDAFCFVRGDLQDYSLLLETTHNVEIIYHLAGQVAVTTSVTDPRGDFEANALGTVNLLEAARQSGNDPIFLFASTNKVYGNLEESGIVEDLTRFVHTGLPHGVSETQALDFYSPYACSKGVADQYVYDYARIYGLRSVVFRQSCIYGYRQFGTEEQGWLAWFIIAALLNRPITVYGSGKQVRDVLFIEDLLDAYDEAIQHIDVTRGQIYNIGGGPQNSLAVWEEFGPLLSRLVGRNITVSHKPPRPGDQLVYISDIRKARRDLGWQPRINLQEGLTRLYEWIAAHREFFS
jgi:CDP-paratose 2-epimerase